MCWQERKAQEKPHLSVSPPAALAPTGGEGGSLSAGGWRWQWGWGRSRSGNTGFPEKVRFGARDEFLDPRR